MELAMLLKVRIEGALLFFIFCLLVLPFTSDDLMVI